MDDNWFHITPEIKEQFNKSTDSNLEEFESAILHLEKNPSDTILLNNAFRSIHTVKGESDYMGYKDIIGLTHEMESVMDLVRKNDIPLNIELTDLLFNCLDYLKLMNANVLKETYQEHDIEIVVARLKLFQSEENQWADEINVRPEVDVVGIYKNTANQHLTYLKELLQPITKGSSSKGIKENAMRILNTFRNSSVYCNFYDNATILLETIKLVESERSIDKETAQSVLDKLAVIDLSVNKPTGVNVSMDANTDVAEEVVTAGILGKDLKISMEKVDDFMNHISELGIVKYRFEYLMKNKPNLNDLDAWYDEMKVVYDKIQQLSYKLGSSIKKIRLVEISALFNRLERIARNTARKKAKKVYLHLSGSSVELDRKVIEYLVDPMIHLIRNAIDHGIETPEERQKSGKSSEGNISVTANRVDNQIIIEIMDDGAGMQLEKIKKNAISKKLTSSQELEQLSEREILSFIFMPGFSTVSQVDEVSGRGVGLDIVKTNLRTIGGNVTVATEISLGTTFTLQVPVEMITLEVLLTEVGDEKYAFPFNTIFETITTETSKLKLINNKWVLPYRGEIINIKNLIEILNPGTTISISEKKQLTVLVVTFGNRIGGVIVDKIIGKAEVLSKPLEKHLSVIREFSGASVLGDGSIVLIIDPASLF